MRFNDWESELGRLDRGGDEEMNKAGSKLA